MSGRWLPKSLFATASKAANIYKAATPAFGQLDRVIPVLRAAQRTTLSLALALRRNARTDAHRGGGARSSGGMGQPRPTKAHMAAARHSSSLRFAERNGVAAECLVLLDGTRTAIGARSARGFWLEGRRCSAEGNAGLRACPLPGENELGRLMAARPRR